MYVCYVLIINTQCCEIAKISLNIALSSPPSINIGVAREGALGARAPPRAEKKCWGQIYRGKL